MRASLALGVRAVANRNASVIRALVVAASDITRAARARDASTNVGSFISTNACSGVLVRERRAMHFWRSGASKMAISGAGLVRFQNVYKLRRYKSSPWLGS